MACLQFVRDISDVDSHPSYIGSEPVGDQYRISSASYSLRCLTFWYIVTVVSLNVLSLIRVSSLKLSTLTESSREMTDSKGLERAVHSNERTGYPSQRSDLDQSSPKQKPNLRLPYTHKPTFPTTGRVGAHQSLSPSNEHSPLLCERLKKDRYYPITYYSTVERPP